jgi:hypothetical protein
MPPLQFTSRYLASDAYLANFFKEGSVTFGPTSPLTKLVSQFKKLIAEFVLNPPPRVEKVAWLSIEVLVEAAAAWAARLHRNRCEQIVCMVKALQGDENEKAMWTYQSTLIRVSGNILWRYFQKFLVELEKKTGLDVAEAFSDVLYRLDQAYHMASEGSLSSGPLPLPAVLVSMHKTAAASE